MDPAPTTPSTPDAELRRPADRSRPMRKATLMGLHTHPTTVGVNIHVYEREGKYLARGRYEGHAFGVSLGDNVQEAYTRLRRLQGEIEDGTFVRSREAGKRLKRQGTIPQLTLRQLCSDFLAEKQKLNGAKTSRDYESRLAPVLDFAERKSALRQWRLARDIDREFVVELKQFLMTRDVTRNGRAGGVPRKMSPRQVINCLETVRGALAWALRADVRKLPPEFVNPLTRELVGQPASKDPLRKSLLPLDERVRLLERMDEWQFLTLSILLVLPLRFEDVSGMLISDVDFEGRTVRLGTRLGGNDFNKGRVTVHLPLPAELLPVLRHCTRGRQDGPLFLSRRAADKSPVSMRVAIEEQFQAKLGRCKAWEITSINDRKQVFRDLLKNLGGVSTDQISSQLKQLLEGRKDVRPYELRAAVTQDMKNAGLGHLELRYLTEHTVADILNSYTGLGVEREMNKYFRSIDPLLAAIRERWEAMTTDTTSSTRSLTPEGTDVRCTRTCA